MLTVHSYGADVTSGTDTSEKAEGLSNASFAGIIIIILS